MCLIIIHSLHQAFTEEDFFAWQRATSSTSESYKQGHVGSKWGRDTFFQLCSALQGGNWFLLVEWRSGKCFAKTIGTVLAKLGGLASCHALVWYPTIWLAASSFLLLCTCTSQVSFVALLSLGQDLKLLFQAKLPFSSRVDKPITGLQNQALIILPCH